MKSNTLNRLTGSLFFLLITLAVITFGFYSARTESKKTPVEKDKKVISAGLKKALDDEFKLFYPLSIDTVYGGFFSDIDYKWQLSGRQDKMIVTQSRHVWSNANAAMYFTDKEHYLKTAKHGFEFLKNVMWDKEYGGFYNLVDRKGKPYRERATQKIIKQIYGHAFAIYGAAAYYKASGDTSALNLAINTFRWIEEHSYDNKYGGYFQFLWRDGTPFTEGYGGIPPKDQNSMIHILEAYTELYNVWPDKLLKEKLNSLLHLIRDTVIGNKGYMTLFFKRDWTPVSYKDSIEAARKNGFELDHISFGHDVETAYLMLEASKSLGIENDTTTLRVAKELDDFALEHGWDTVNFGVYDRGYIFKGESEVKIVKNTKEWWCHIEALNSFLMMAELFSGDRHNYYDRFCEEWNFIQQYLLDHKYGGWYWSGLDTFPNAKFAAKASIWKCNYHTSRGLINCIKRLEQFK